jgi:hypothetical protein
VARRISQDNFSPGTHANGTEDFWLNFILFGVTMSRKISFGGFEKSTNQSFNVCPANEREWETKSRGSKEHFIPP